MVKVFRYRIKSLNGLLNRQSRSVNFVWNFCNDTQKFALKWHKRWPTGFDLNKLTTGTSKELGLHAGTINHGIFSNMSDAQARQVIDGYKNA